MSCCGSRNPLLAARSQDFDRCHSLLLAASAPGGARKRPRFGNPPNTIADGLYTKSAAIASRDAKKLSDCQIGKTVRLPAGGEAVGPQRGRFGKRAWSKCVGSGGTGHRRAAQDAGCLTGGMRGRISAYDGLMKRSGTSLSKNGKNEEKRLQRRIHVCKIKMVYCRFQEDA